MSGRRSISNSFNVITVDDPVSVVAQYAPNANPSSGQIHDTWQAGDLYMRTKSTEDGSSWSSWHKIVGESGDETDYTFNISKSLTSSRATTAPANCYYNTWQDAPIAPTSTYPYLWMKVVKKTWNESTQSYDSGMPSYARITGEKGENAFVVDLENEMTNLALDENGNLMSAFDIYFKVRAYYGTQNVISDSACSISASCSNSDVTISTTYAKTTGIRVQIANGTAMADTTEISVTVTHTTYGTRTVVFTLAGVRGGENAILQELLPSLSDISFARQTDGSLTPASRSLTLSIKKTQGSSTSTQSISESGLIIRWSTSSMPAHSTDGNSWGSGTTTGISWSSTTMQIANSVVATNIYIAAFKTSSGTLVDRETIPIIKDGNNGNDGEDAPAAFASPEKITIQCYSNGNVKAETTTNVNFSLKVGSHDVTVSSVTCNSYPTNVVVTGVAANAQTIKVPTSQTASGIASGCTFTVSGTYDSKTFSAKVTVALIGSAQGAQGNPGSPGGKGDDAQYIYLKGTGHDNPISAVCRINDGSTVIERTNMTRGLTLILINRLTLEIYSQQSYDVYGESVSAGETQCANLATAINNASSSYFVCVVSFDAVRWTNNLIAALQSCGSKGIDDTTAYRVPFAFIGYKGLPQGYAIQMQTAQGASASPAEVTAYVSNGALSTSKDPTAGRLGGRFYYDAGDYEYSSSLSFRVTVDEAPYFFYNNDYWVFEPNVTTDTTYTTAEMGYPSSTNSNWHLMMYNTQRFFMTDAIFGKYAHFGSAIISGDWIISSNGKSLGSNYANDSYMTGRVIKASGTGDFKIKAYTLFEPNNPLNDNESIDSGTNITIGASAQTASMCQPYLTKGKVYKLTVVGHKKTSDSSVYVRIRNNSYGTYSAIYLANTSDYTYTITFQVETSGYYYIEMYQPTLPSSSSGGGVVTSYSLVRALFKTAYAVDLKLGISYQTQIYASGGLRSPFTFINEHSKLTSNFNDNSALYSYSSSWGYDSYYDLPWDVTQSGRKICLTNYKWNGTEQATSGYCYINAPSGKYFYEDGVRKTMLRMSREGVELLGFGDTNEFYGWIVIKRFDLVTANRYGRSFKVMATGRVTGSSSGASVSYHTFDGTTMTVTRDAEGVYTLSWDNNSWFSSSGNVFALVTAYGTPVDSNYACFAFIKEQTRTSITVWVADDYTPGDGSFNFLISNFSDWIYAEPAVNNN